MKKLPIMAVLMMTASLAMAVEPAKPEPKASAPSVSTKRLDTAVASTDKPNKIKRGKVTYTGAAVSVVKSKNPLQLINPFAPMSYGSSEDNTVRDPISGRASGVNLVAAGF
jgi:hypothetical protein